MTPTQEAAIRQALEACEQRLPLKGQAAIIDELNNLRAALADLEQTSLELCETCGWRALIPGDCCLNCTRKPLTEEEIQAAWDSVDMRHPRGNETRIAFARAIERAHGIGD